MAKSKFAQAQTLLNEIRTLADRAIAGSNETEVIPLFDVMKLTAAAVRLDEMFTVKKERGDVKE